MPVYRQGMIASPYPTMFADEPCFLIDARLHEGSSGSPVLNSPHNILTNDKGAFHSSNTILLGVFSADYDFDGNGGNDPLGLNKVS